MIDSKEDIIKQLKQNAGRFYHWVDMQEDRSFEKGPDGKWTTGHHLRILDQKYEK